jgi:hypothetical protein
MPKGSAPGLESGIIMEVMYGARLLIASYFNRSKDFDQSSPGSAPRLGTQVNGPGRVIFVLTIEA